MNEMPPAYRLHYIVQGHRFDLIQYLGTCPTTYTSLRTIFWVRQLVVVALTLHCVCTTLAHFFRHRLQLRAPPHVPVSTRAYPLPLPALHGHGAHADALGHLRHRRQHVVHIQSALTPSRYLRFMGMALTQMLWAAFVTVANMLFIVSPRHLPWVSWVSVHSGSSRVGVFSWLFSYPRRSDRGLSRVWGGGRRVVRIPEKKQMPIPLSPSSFATHTDINTATETDGPAYSSYWSDTLDIQGLLLVVFTFWRHASTFRFAFRAGWLRRDLRGANLFFLQE
ncbi:hypothetical protein K438DRAFT_2120114 [Mycena galopus ATCC 62051]|nr:hypothetical protein K438DRAFT_2120114 [Mycena galopus ATCC 62051]